ncbi:MAG: hypothetical protein R2882_02110 [Gemmatimonadales bacterium]
MAAGFIAAPVALGAGLGSAWSAFEFLINGYNLWSLRAGRRHRALLDVGTDRPLPVTAGQAANAQIGTEPASDRIVHAVEAPGTPVAAPESLRLDDLVVLIPTKPPGGFVTRREMIRLEGPAALAAVGQLLRIVNQHGGRRSQIEAAAALLDEAPGPDQQLGALLTQVVAKRYSGQRELGQQPAELRLALEMAAHEQAERLWLADELAALERAWKTAEEIAAIADRLALPAAIERQLASLKEQGRIQA